MAAKFQVISFDEPAGKVREQKKRRFHAKTRAGCIGCKTKRVKVRVPYFFHPFLLLNSCQSYPPLT